MSGRLPQIQQRDEDIQIRKLINQMRRNLPGPALLRFSVQVNLLVNASTLIVPDNDSGWVTSFINVIVDEMVGAQITEPEFSTGTVSGGLTDVAGDQSLSLTPVVGEVQLITLRSPMHAETEAIYAVVSNAGTGPTTFTAMVYIAGYFM